MASRPWKTLESDWQVENEVYSVFMKRASQKAPAWQQGSVEQKHKDQELSASEIQQKRWHESIALCLCHIKADTEQGRFFLRKIS